MLRGLSLGWFLSFCGHKCWMGNMESFMFSRRKKVIHVWFNIRVIKWGQNFNFGVNCLFNSVLNFFFGSVFKKEHFKCFSDIKSVCHNRTCSWKQSQTFLIHHAVWLLVCVRKRFPYNRCLQGRTASIFLFASGYGDRLLLQVCIKSIIASFWTLKVPCFPKNSLRSRVLRASCLLTWA